MSDTAPLLEADSDRFSSSNGMREFMWKDKPCWGNELHMAVAEGDREKVLQILRSSPNPQDLCRSMATCRTPMSPQFAGGSVSDQTVELSAEPIHIAASKGTLDIVKDLLAHRASLLAPLNKDGHPYCEVLQTALLGDGAGAGLEDVVRFLLSETGIRHSAFGKHPLHFAAMSGKPSLVCIVRHWMKKQGIKEADILTTTTEAPLTLAIQMAAMTLKDLVLSAEASAFSLKVFMRDCPEAVPLFLQRMKNLGLIKAVVEEANISSLDLANLLRESPAGAERILAAATERPGCDEEHYPLPTNVSFAARTYEQVMWNLVNRGASSVEVFTSLESEDKWLMSGYHSHWHQSLHDTSFGRPIRAPEIRVCRIPNLISPQLFVALAASDVDVKIFDNNLVAFLVSHVFEHHAGPAETVRCFVNLWILILLNLHTWYFHEPEQIPSGIVWVTVRFLAAQSIVDVFMEVVQFYGYAAIGQPRDYLQLENFLDLLSAVIPSYLWFNPQCDVVMLLTIFLYWCRILNFASFCEPIGRTLQPFSKIFRGLGPVLFVTLIAFLAFSHAFFSLKNGKFKGSVYGTFVILMTAGLPSEPSDNELESMLLYVSVTFFTVFILNIFIGVIGEEYSRLKEECSLGFKQLRAKMCLDYILRKHFFQIHICSKTMSKVICLTAISIGMIIQFLSAFNDGHDFVASEGFSYVFLLAIMHGVFYNSPGSHALLTPTSGTAPTYFWYCCEAERELVEEEDLQEISFDET